MRSHFILSYGFLQRACLATATIGFVLANSGPVRADFPSQPPTLQMSAHAEFCDDMLDSCLADIVPGFGDLFQQYVDCLESFYECQTLEIEFFEVDPLVEPELFEPPPLDICP